MTPMERDSRKGAGEEGLEWGPDTIEAEIRERVRGMIEAIVEEELESALGASRSQRVGMARTGYRHGARERQLTTSLGKTTIKLPRARLRGADGDESEWRSRIIGRYQRRTERVDGALLGTYLSGVNSRRLRGLWRVTNDAVVTPPDHALETGSHGTNECTVSVLAA